jgi:hypothetical protein
VGSGGTADPITWVQVLAVVSPLVGALIAVSGVIGTIIFTNRRERTRQEHERQLARDRQEHERQLKLEELEDQRQSRLRDERRQVYSEFVASWHSYEDARTRRPRDQEEFVKANLAFQRSFNALSLIAPNEVRAAADGIRQEEVRGRRQEVSGAPGRFWEAARKDLGIPD